jgi:hypothetical protein
VLVKAEEPAPAITDALKKAVAPVADVIVQRQEQQAGVCADMPHPVVIEGQHVL